MENKLTLRDIKKVFSDCNHRCIYRSLHGLRESLDTSNSLHKFTLQALDKLEEEYKDPIAQLSHGEAGNGSVFEAQTWSSFLDPVDLNGKTVVEYGCAEGTITYCLLKSFTPKKIIAVDSNKDSLKICECVKDINNFDNLEIVNADYCVADIQGDVAICVDFPLSCSDTDVDTLNKIKNNTTTCIYFNEQPCSAEYKFITEVFCNNQIMTVVDEAADCYCLKVLL